MKKQYKEVIQMEVPVQAIAEKLHSMMVDFKHSELVTETIIGHLLKNSTGLSNLFNSLNGYNNDIDFKVGDIIITEKQSLSGYALVNGERKNVEVKEAKVIEIDLYKHDKLQVEYDTIDSALNPKKNIAWVDHKYWNKVPKEV